MARREARIEQSRWEVARCRCAFGQWLERRQRADESGQYASQLTAIELVVRENLGRMDGALDAIAIDRPVGEVYGGCLRVDRHLAWLNRLWDYFRDKWDQRDDPDAAPTLAAADELVWSSYAPPFRHLDLSVGPAPLPYVAGEFSPHAIPRSRPPRRLRRGDELLSQALDRLPVSVIGIPGLCLANPWWLVLIPHEVGHQVAYELDGGRLAGTVAAVVGDAASRIGGDGLGEDWRGWAHELFADAYAGAMVGAAHLWALAELEQGDEESMVRGTQGYPPPVARHAVAAELLRGLGLRDEEALPPLPTPLVLEGLALEDADRERTERLLAAAPAVAAALVEEPLVGCASLRDLASPDPDRLSRSGRAGMWHKELAGPLEARPEPTLEAPRLAAVGALAEWAETMQDPDAGGRRARAQRLRERMLAVVGGSHEPGVRAAADEDGAAVAELAREIAGEAMAVTAEADEEQTSEPAPPAEIVAGG